MSAAIVPPAPPAIPVSSRIAAVVGTIRSS
jgi:hypothetical protein